MPSLRGGVPGRHEDSPKLGVARSNRARVTTRSGLWVGSPLPAAFFRGHRAPKNVPHGARMMHNHCGKGLVATARAFTRHMVLLCYSWEGSEILCSFRFLLYVG